MSTKTQTSAEQPVEGTVRLTWLKAMYAANIVVSGGTGIGSLVAPGATRAVLGIPPQDPVMFGIASGAVPLAFGLAGVLGLRAPIRLAPVLLLQVLYKAAFLVAVVLPLAVAGQFPAFAVPLVGLFAVFIVGDLIAIPFPYLFSAESPPRSVEA